VKIGLQHKATIILAFITRAPTGYVLSAGGTRVAMFASYADSVRSFTAIFRVYHTGQARPQSVRDRVAEQRQVRDRYTDRSEASRLCR